MMLIACPYCGPRSLTEFTFERPIETIVPFDASSEEVVRRIYTRKIREVRQWSYGVTLTGAGRGWRCDETLRPTRSSTLRPSGQDRERLYKDP